MLFLGHAMQQRVNTDTAILYRNELRTIKTGHLIQIRFIIQGALAKSTVVYYMDGHIAQRFFSPSSPF